MRVRAIHLHLRKQRKADGVGEAAELPDVLGAARFLRAELVAGKAHHREALRAVFLPERFQARVLRREAALAGHVHYQYHLPAEVREAAGLTFERVGGEVVQGGHGGS